LFPGTLQFNELSPLPRCRQAQPQTIKLKIHRHRTPPPPSGTQAAALFEKNGILNWNTFKELFVLSKEAPRGQKS
jgi:hypothetical protein